MNMKVHLDELRQALPYRLRTVVDAVHIGWMVLVLFWAEEKRSDNEGR